MITESQQIGLGFEFDHRLEKASIEKFFGNDLSFCHKMFEVFLLTVPKDLEALHDAVSEKDFIAIKTLAHKLKTNFQFVGLNKISSLLESIEKNSKLESSETYVNYDEFHSLIEDGMSLIKSETIRIACHLKN